MKRFMRMPPLGTIALAVLTVWGGTAHAVGLGNIRVESALGQPLRVAISMIGADSADLAPNCLRARIESSDGVFISTPAIAVLHTASGNAVELRTRQSINEPAILVALDIACSTQVHRDFQILLDPVAAATLPALAPATSIPDETRASGAVKPARNDRTARAAVPVQLGNKRRSVGTVSRSTAGAGTIRSDNILAKAAVLGPPKSILKLSGEALTREDLLALGHLKLSDTLGEPSSASAGAGVLPNEDLSAARNRFAAILRGEDPLQAAQRIHRAEQAQIAELRQQTVGISQQRAADLVAIETLRQRSLPFGWIVGLIGLLITSLAAAGWLAWRLALVRRQHHTPSWDNSLTSEESLQASGSHAVAGDDFSVPRRTPASGLYKTGKKSPANLASVPDFLRGGGTDDRTERLIAPAMPVADTAAEAAAAASAAERREALQFYPAKVENLKVEEISDVMQEAEFWMSLNDPQRAIEILEPYSNVEQPDSPIPWLYLLDLYRGTGERTKYEILQPRAQRLFNARIPAWDEDGDITDGRTLEDYPHVVERICEYWETSHILLYLESLIFDNREGVREGFDLAVYQEIMLLMTIARDMHAARSADLSGGKALQFTTG